MKSTGNFPELSLSNTIYLVIFKEKCFTLTWGQNVLVLHGATIFLLDVDLSFDVSCLAFYIGVQNRDHRQNHEIIVHILRNANSLMKID